MNKLICLGSTAVTLMRRGKWPALWLAAIATLPQYARATCTFYPGARTESVTVSTPASVTVPRNAANGTVIYNSSFVAPTHQVGTTASFSCDVDTQNGLTNSLGAQPSSGVRIYPIGTTGLSFAWTYSYSGDDVTPIAGPRVNPAGKGFGFGGATFAFKLIKTGPIAANAGVSAGQTATWDTGNLTLLQLNLGNDIQITPQTCRVTSGTQHVLLTKASGLPTRVFGGIGSTSPPVGFSITVDCTNTAEGVRVNMAFTDQQTPGNSTRQLPLSTTTTGTNAKGVQIQILYNNFPVRFGRPLAAADNPAQFYVFTTSDNSPINTIQFAARYIQTESEVTSGNASGIATFTMSYQ